MVALVSHLLGVFRFVHQSCSSLHSFFTNQNPSQNMRPCVNRNSCYASAKAIRGAGSYSHTEAMALPMFAAMSLAVAPNSPCSIAAISPATPWTKQLMKAAISGL